LARISIKDRLFEVADWVECGAGYGSVGYSTGQGPETSTFIKGGVLISSSIISAKR